MQGIEPLALFKKLFFIIIFLACGKVLPQAYPVKEIDSLLKTGINCILKQEYSKAENCFIKLDKEYSDLPLGKIYIAASSIAKSFDRAEEYDAYTILNNLTIAKDMSEKLIDSNKNNIWYHYFNALAIGYRAYYNAVNENWVAAFSNGLSAVDEFNICLEMDHNFSDALIAAGSYKYWRSRKTESFNWLPFVSDERELGITYLQHAESGSSYNNYLSDLSLIWIFVDKGNFREAVNIGENAVKKAPQSRIIKWALARAYENVDTLKAVDIYLQILNSYGDLNKYNRVNEVVLKHKIAQLYFRMGQYEKCLNFCNEILGIKKLSPFAAEKLKDRLEKVKILYSAVKAKLK